MGTIRNNVQLIGNVGATPVIKNMTNGKAMAQISLATNRIFKNEKGEKETKTNWHRLVVWGDQSNIVQKYIQKGSEIAVNGMLSSYIYLDKQGNSHRSDEVIVHELKVISRGKKD